MDSWIENEYRKIIVKEIFGEENKSVCKSGKSNPFQNVAASMSCVHKLLESYGPVCGWPDTDRVSHP